MPASNLVASTLMVRLPLIKLAGVANGETKAELMKALGFKNESWVSLVPVDVLYLKCKKIIRQQKLKMFFKKAT